MADADVNILGPTSVEYSPFWGGGASGVASSELIVSQEIDFPSLFSLRRKASKAQQEVSHLQLQTLRRDILLEAKKLCYDISASVSLRNLMNSRLQSADSLLSLYERSMNNGNATLIDVNRIKMDRMEVAAQRVKAEGEISALWTQLQALNGGKSIEGMDNFVLEPEPEAVAIGTIPLEKQEAKATIDASACDLRLAKNSWLPTLTVGYRRNTELHEAVNGFVVGMSVPLFSNAGKAKAARLRQQAAEAQLANAAAQSDSRNNVLEAQARQLKASIQAYDMPLLQQTMALINKAIAAGAMTILEYYSQADRIYNAMQKMIELENEYNKVLSELHRDNL